MNPMKYLTIVFVVATPEMAEVVYVGVLWQTKWCRTLKNTKQHWVQQTPPLCIDLNSLDFNFTNS
jgi:hypothetical protein